MWLVKKGRSLYWRCAEWSFVMAALCLLLVYARTVRPIPGAARRGEATLMRGGEKSDRPT
jgi:hypothetical protein